MRESVLTANRAPLSERGSLAHCGAVTVWHRRAGALGRWLPKSPAATS